jgi:hypothetical protein
MMLCGFGLIAGAGWSAAALLPATLVAYTPVVLVEERALAALFGDDYRRYIACVPRWLGSPRPYSSGHDGALVCWREVFYREKWLVPGCLAAVAAIAAMHGARLSAPRIAERLELAVGFDLAVLIWATAGFAITANAIKVEIDQRRRCARRAAKFHAAATMNRRARCGRRR